METLTFPILVGIAVPWLVALLTNDAMSSNKKRWVTIFITILIGLLAALGVAMYYDVFNAFNRFSRRWAGGIDAYAAGC